MPLIDYGRNDGRSITGGSVYRGKRLPALAGYYIFGDFVSGRIWALRQNANAIDHRLVAETKLLISTFGVDKDGELYIANYADGRLYRLKQK